jgi:biopolymer transport protein ExbD
MITRPLDLASRLRPEPRSFDFLFFVNVGLIGLFFALFGSPFVLAPGLGVDFRLPTVAGANTNAIRATQVITVMSTGQIFTEHGPRQIGELDEWLARHARTTKEPMLLVRGDARVPTSVLASIASAAKKAGFVEVLWAAGEPAGQNGAGGR